MRIIAACLVLGLSILGSTVASADRGGFGGQDAFGFNWAEGTGIGAISPRMKAMMPKSTPRRVVPKSTPRRVVPKTPPRRVEARPRSESRYAVPAYIAAFGRQFATTNGR